MIRNFDPLGILSMVGLGLKFNQF